MRNGAGIIFGQTAKIDRKDDCFFIISSMSLFHRARAVQERLQRLRMEAASASNSGRQDPLCCYLGWSSARVNYWRAGVSGVTKDECCHAAIPTCLENTCTRVYPPPSLPLSTRN